jgi:hypothetical protein
VGDGRLSEPSSLISLYDAQLKSRQGWQILHGLNARTRHEPRDFLERLLLVQREFAFLIFFIRSVRATKSDEESGKQGWRFHLHGFAEIVDGVACLIITNSLAASMRL